MQTKQSEEKRSTLRRNAILEALDLTNSIKVSTLSNDLHVSEVTIRKDLEYLEAEGLLVKIHGGARKCENTSSEIRLHHKQAEKKQIAEAAAALVKEGDFIFVNEKLLSEKNTLLSFGSLDSKYGRKIDCFEDPDLLVLVTSKNKFYLKRLYG